MARRMYVVGSMVLTFLLGAAYLVVGITVMVATAKAVFGPIPARQSNPVQADGRFTRRAA